eukprot:scaffold22484_cov22-Tisochrysis_lutea.AAC.3
MHSRLGAGLIPKLITHSSNHSPSLLRRPIRVGYPSGTRALVPMLGLRMHAGLGARIESCSCCCAHLHG